MGKKCCGSKLGMDYSGINRIPYFGKRKDRDAWLKKRKPSIVEETEEPTDSPISESSTPEVHVEEKVESLEIVEPSREIPQIDQSILVQLECREVESPEEDS